MPQVGVTGSKVVTLVPSMLRTKSRAADGHEERGRVLLFTGVRYERRIELPGGDSRPASGREDDPS